jgi:hypothetical protein
LGCGDSRKDFGIGLVKRVSYRAMCVDIYQAWYDQAPSDVDSRDVLVQRITWYEPHDAAPIDKQRLPGDHCLWQDHSAINQRKKCHGGTIRRYPPSIRPNESMLWSDAPGLTKTF